jgi:hypothetical protein
VCAGAAEAQPRQRTDQPFFVGFFFAGAATERTVLTLPASALTPFFFDMAIAFYLCMCEPMQLIIVMY